MIACHYGVVHILKFNEELSRLQLTTLLSETTQGQIRSLASAAPSVKSSGFTICDINNNKNKKTKMHWITRGSEKEKVSFTLTFVHAHNIPEGWSHGNGGRHTPITSAASFSPRGAPTAGASSSFRRRAQAANLLHTHAGHSAAKCRLKAWGFPQREFEGPAAEVEVQPQESSSSELEGHRRSYDGMARASCPSCMAADTCANTTRYTPPGARDHDWPAGPSPCVADLFLDIDFRVCHC